MTLPTDPDKQILALLFSAWNKHPSGPHKFAIDMGLEPNLRWHYNQGRRRSISLRTACDIADALGYELVLMTKDGKRV